jgi:hypothetical protein
VADDLHIGEAFAVIMVNVINFSGHARAFDKLEAVGAKVRQVAENPLYRDHYHMQDSIGRAAGNAIARYAQAGSDSRLILPWMTFLAHHAQHYPSHAGVQAVAGTFKLAFVQQLLDHFPHGKVEVKSRISSRTVERRRGGRRHPTFE